MKLVTLHQPWATFIACGAKQYETRHWANDYRGKLLIHAAARRMDDHGRELYAEVGLLHPMEPVSDVPRGVIVAVADLTACLRMVDASTDCLGAENSTIYIPHVSELERKVGGWGLGRFAFKLENVVKLPMPIFYKATQGKFLKVSEELELEVRRQVGHG